MKGTFSFWLFRELDSNALCVSILCIPKDNPFLLLSGLHKRIWRGGARSEEENAPMAMKWLINIHEVRNHSGARHQSQKVVKMLFLISSRHSILHCSFLLWVLGPSLFISVDYIAFVSRYKCVDVCWRSVHSVGDLNRSLFSRHSLPPPLQGMHTSQKIAPAASFTHIQMYSTARLCSWIYVCICKPQTSSHANFYTGL